MPDTHQLDAGQNYCSRQTGQCAIVERDGQFFAGHGRWTPSRSEAWPFTDGATEAAARQLGDGARAVPIEAEK